MQNATLPELQAWARSVMERKPDFVIGADYLRRWWVIPRNRWFNIYLHRIRHDDDDRALHDHPWANITLVLKGAYVEHTPHGTFRRDAGDVVRKRLPGLSDLDLRRPAAGRRDDLARPSSADGRHGHVHRHVRAAGGQWLVERVWEVKERLENER
jgi:hypothetical protein